MNFFRINIIVGLLLNVYFYFVFKKKIKKSDLEDDLRLKAGSSVLNSVKEQSDNNSTIYKRIIFTIGSFVPIFNIVLLLGMMVIYNSIMDNR